METAARAIGEGYGCAVLLKGGHQLNDANDLLYRDKKLKWFKGRRIDNPNTHGTGCTLSSAIASNLAKGMDMDLAVERGQGISLRRAGSPAGPGKGKRTNESWICHPGRVLRGNEHEGKDKYKGKRDLPCLPTALYGLGQGYP